MRVLVLTGCGSGVQQMGKRSILNSHLCREDGGQLVGAAQKGAAQKGVHGEVAAGSDERPHPVEEAQDAVSAKV